MAIRVKNGANPGVTAVAAAAGGQSLERRGAELTGTQQLVSQNARDRARADELEFRANQNAINRNFQERQQDLAANRADRRAATENRRDLERLAIGTAVGQRAFEDRVEFEFTAEQRQRAARLTDSLAQLEASDSFTEEEKVEARRQIEDQFYGIQRQPRLAEQSPFEQGQGIGESWVSPDGNFLLTRDDKGNVKKLDRIPQPEAEAAPFRPELSDIVKLRKEAVEHYRSLERTDAEGNPRKVTEAEIERYVRDVIKFQQSFEVEGSASSPTSQSAEDEDLSGFSILGIR